MKQIAQATATILKNVKRGAQIGVLGAALTAGTMMGVGCDNAADGDTKDNQNVTSSRYDTPYDKKLGNGNYFVHSFIGDKDGIYPDTAVTDVRHYMDLGETYLKDLGKKFDNSLNGRPAAQNYFSVLSNGLKNNPYYDDQKSTELGQKLDLITSTLSLNCKPILIDIIKNLSKNEERVAFYLGYRAMENEAYKVGLGNYRDHQSTLMDAYKSNRQYVRNYWPNNALLNSVDVDNDIDNQNCRHITNTMDTVLNTAATNMNNRYGYGVTAADLRQVVNITMTTKSAQAMHDLTSYNLKHNGCGMYLDIINSMYQTAEDMFQAEQNQGMTY